MFEIRGAAERGHANHGWLDSWHSFSFADYYDAQHMHFGTLRVINEDRVQPGMGFGMHGHRDMEIVSYVLEGELEHRDNIGNSGIIRPGDVQRMSAGSGVLHSEFNSSKTDPVHFLQIWVLPKFTGTRPSHEQKFFSPEQKRGKLRLIASQDGRDGSVTINQDASIYATQLDDNESATIELGSDRIAYFHVARGTLEVNGTRLGAGDGVKISGNGSLRLANGTAAEVLMFDLSAAASAGTRP